MRIKEAIQILTKQLEEYGDCKLTKFNEIEIAPKEITEIKFIGADRILLKTDDNIDKNNIRIYETYQKKINKQRKKEWRKDCE